MKMNGDYLNDIEDILSKLSEYELDEKIEMINSIRRMIHEHSPFKTEPVDCVLWVKNSLVTANDYNPNKVAPPEMKLLELSIANDGYTQPIVAWSNEEKNKIEVIDGFHRNRVGTESNVIQRRVHGYLPIVDIRTEQSSKSDRMASTIRHNRARGKHQVDAMSEIVIELKRRNWKNTRIAKELGMDEEEVLRLCQISGIEDLFGDKDFSRSWDSIDSVDIVDDWEDITDIVDDIVISDTRTVNTSDKQRIFHTYEKWECHKAGFYASTFDGKTSDECKKEYANFLSNGELFNKIVLKVIIEWPNSCEHYLTNSAMNRIAWLGQASMCYATGIPSKYCSGFNLLSDREKEFANQIALNALNKWLSNNNRDLVSMDEGLSLGRQMEIY